MMTPSAQHQLGTFIVAFQHVEAAITNLLVQIASGDSETVSILISELDFSQRVRTVDVLFARFVDLRSTRGVAVKGEFHKLMDKVNKLSTRRNEMVHSKYHHWKDVDGKAGLLRRNSKLRASKGLREKDEEELLPEAFDADLKNLSEILSALESFRLRVIDWQYPNAEA